MKKIKSSGDTNFFLCSQSTWGTSKLSKTDKNSRILFIKSKCQNQDQTHG